MSARRLAWTAALVGCLTVCVSAQALAAQRYASPSGSGSACSSGSPCSIQTAFSGAADFDEIILATGDYGPVSSILDVPSNGSAHGTQGQPAPRIHFGSGSYLLLTPGSRASYLQVDGVTPAPLQVDQPDAVADQVISHSTGSGACIIFGTLINSVCWASGTNYPATETVTAANQAITIRNSTLVGTNAGLMIHAEGASVVTATAVNVITRGGMSDARLTEDAGTNLTLNIDHSNHGAISNTGATINETNGQTAAPAFVNAAAGDFSEAAGSPTIDAGVTNAANGAFDVVGLPRVIGGGTDIGAYEYDPFAGVVIGNQKSKVKKRKAPVRVGCPAGTLSRCAGTLALTYRQGKKTLTAGTAQFSIDAGATVKVKVKLSKRALKRLEARGKLKLAASATATDGVGKTASSTGKVKLKG